MSDHPIKCASNEFKSQPFYVIQSNGKDRRYIASFLDKPKTKSFLLLFINGSTSLLQLKIRDLDESEDPKEFCGTERIAGSI
jgi:hypothetical protein